MKYFSVYLISLLSFSVFSQGLVLSTSDEMNQIELYDTESLGFAIDAPSSYSLERYVPEVVEQDGGTCVGYAAFYYGLSTMYNERFGVTSSKGKLAHSFDPNFIYSIIQNQIDYNCDEGLHFYEAFDLLKRIGAKKLFFTPFVDCNSTWNNSLLDNLAEYTLPYAIEEYYHFKLDNPGLIENMKSAISNNHPLFGAFNFVNSLYSFSSDNPNGVDYTGLWTPNQYEEIDGGHAMSIVGYDDYKYGGSFRVVNSWGKNYGDNGYIWMRYSDFKKFAKEIYFFVLNEGIMNSGSNPQIDINNYTRINLDRGGNYEGQYSFREFNGLGILSNSRNNWYVIGDFTPELNGSIIYIDDDGIFTGYAENDKIIELESYGFASSEKVDQNTKNLSEHIKKAGLNYSIRKANSTKTNSIDFDYK